MASRDPGWREGGWEGDGHDKVLRNCLLTDAEKLDLERSIFFSFFLQRTKIVFFVKKKKNLSSRTTKSLWKVVILRQQHNYVTWHSMSLEPATVWGEGGVWGPSPLGRLRLCLPVRPLMVVVKERCELIQKQEMSRDLEIFM